MGKLVANINMSLDGVIQGPGGPEEDTRNGFTAGGWAIRHFDDELAKIMDLRESAAMLYGRNTYEILAGYWPHQSADDPFANEMNAQRKYVVSNTLTEPLTWQNTTVLSGDTIAAIARLKQEIDGTIVILGSGELLRSLYPTGLIDEYSLLIYPEVVGKGFRLFPETDDPRQLQLIECKSTAMGVIVARFAPR